jgi:hypothetical protein
MSETKCPSCGFGFDNHRSAGPEQLRGRMLFGPERLIANAKLNDASFDICPNCGSRFPSAEFRIFGEFARSKLRSMGASTPLLEYPSSLLASQFGLGASSGHGAL